MLESEMEVGLGSEMDKNSETHGMQDINYTFYHCMEITVELRRCKYPMVINSNYLALASSGLKLS